MNLQQKSLEGALNLVRGEVMREQIDPPELTLEQEQTYEIRLKEKVAEMWDSDGDVSDAIESVMGNDLSIKHLIRLDEPRATSKLREGIQGYFERAAEDLVSVPTSDDL
jgi:hypothetical protein